MQSRPLVTILTFCAHPALAYGTLLTFKTLRVGFPTADVEVFDNGSHPAVRARIAEAAERVGATFRELSSRSYVDHLRWLLIDRQHEGRPLVLVDPDVIFWDRVEAWSFGDALMAGRLIAAGDFVGTARLHPSHLWVPNVARLRHAVDECRRELGVAWDGIGPRRELIDGRRVFADTMASLYRAIRSRCVAFRSDQLDCFDHLFYGSHLPIVDAVHGDELSPVRDAHQAAALGELGKLRGLWRAQDVLFASHRNDMPLQGRTPASHRDALLRSMRAIEQWQGVRTSEAQIAAAFRRLVSMLGLDN